MRRQFIALLSGTALVFTALAPASSVVPATLGSGHAADTVLATGENSPLEVQVNRVGGAHRYATAANLSRQWNGVHRVYVAAGGVATDAMVASVRAGVARGPVLLTATENLPNSTREAIQRLSPETIVVVGGAQSVRPHVFDELQGLAPDVQRVYGADRYSTSAEVSSEYSAGRDRVYLVGGEAPADALSVSALAGMEKEPMLLTKRDMLPAVINQELQRLAPQEIVVVGGPESVSEAVAQQAAAHSVSGTVTRLAGPDRYTTAEAVAAQFPEGQARAYVASGQVMADGLVSGAAGARHGTAVVLTRGDHLSSAAERSLVRLDPDRVDVVGGPVTVTNDVLSLIDDILNGPRDPVPPPPGPSGFLAGAYNGMAPGDDEAFEELVGEVGLGHGVSYYNAGQVGPNNWPTQRDLERLDNGMTLLMGMASKNWNKGGQDSYMAWRDIANGVHDAEIRGWGQRLDELDGEIWFAFDIEPDVKVHQGHVPDDWTPEEFAAAAQRISTLLAQEAPEVKFTFWVGGTQRHLVRDMYPGDDVVDIICWDPYVNQHRPPTTTPLQLWSEFKVWLDNEPWGNGKTIGLCETGYHNGHPDALGAQFWEQAPVAAQELDLAFVTYFHRNSGPNGNYTMDNMPLSAEAYRDAMVELQSGG